MDVTTVTDYRFARSRADLALAPGERVLGGGTWLFSEPQPDTTGLVDLSTLGWPDLECTEHGLRIAASCTIAALLAWSRGPSAPEAWTALPIVERAANALLASFKIWNTATVGGNICCSFAAGAMISLTVALDGEAEIWTPDGGDRRTPVSALITGNGSNALAPGEVLRSVRIPSSALRARASLEKIALAEHGRSGAVVTGRRDEDGRAVFGVTAATLTPQVLRFPRLPDGAELADAVAGAAGFYTDPFGAADWRRAVSVVLAERIRRRLEEA